MKKILLSIVAIFCITANANVSFAGNRESGNNCPRANLNEINIIYGFPSFTGLGLGFGLLVSGAALKEVQNVDMIGAFTGEYYRYTRNGRWAFGAGVSYECIPVTYNHIVSATGSVKAPLHCITVMPSAKVVWFNKKAVGMYSKLALGVGLTVDTSIAGSQKLSPNFAFQVNPVCVEFGGEMFRGFIEAGLGMQGLAMCGLRVNL